MGTVKDLWETFAAWALPADTPAGRRRALRRAFYAGAWGLLRQLQRAAEADRLDRGAGVAYLEAREAELRAFARDLQEGRD